MTTQAQGVGPALSNLYNECHKVVAPMVEMIAAKVQHFCKNEGSNIAHNAVTVAKNASALAQANPQVAAGVALVTTALVGRKTIVKTMGTAKQAVKDGCAAGVQNSKLFSKKTIAKAKDCAGAGSDLVKSGFKMLNDREVRLQKAEQDRTTAIKNLLKPIDINKGLISPTAAQEQRVLNRKAWAVMLTVAALAFTTIFLGLASGGFGPLSGILSATKGGAATLATLASLFAVGTLYTAIHLTNHYNMGKYSTKKKDGVASEEQSNTNNALSFVGHALVSPIVAPLHLPFMLAKKVYDYSPLERYKAR